MVIRADELVINIGHGIGRHRKAYAHVTLRKTLCEYRRIDADHFPVHVDQRTAGIAGIDGCVGLNERLELLASDNIASFGGNNAGGDGLLQTEGAADGQHPVADLHTVGIPQLGRLQRMTGAWLDFDDGEVGFTVAANNFAVVGLRISLQLHSDAIGAFDDVLIGHNIAFGVNNHAGAERPFRPAGIRSLATAAAKETIEEIVKGVVVLIVGSLRPAPTRCLRRSSVRLGNALSVDVHHRGLHLLGDLGKYGRLLLWISGWHLDGAAVRKQRAP